MEEVMPRPHVLEELGFSIENILIQLTSIVIKNLIRSFFLVLEKSSKGILSPLSPIYQVESIAMAMQRTEEQEHVPNPP